MQVLGLSSVKGWTVGDYLSQASSIALVLVCFSRGSDVREGAVSSWRRGRGRGGRGAGTGVGSALGGDLGVRLLGEGSEEDAIEEEGGEGGMGGDVEGELEPLLEAVHDEEVVIGLRSVVDASLKPVLAAMLMTWPISFKGLLYSPLLLLSCR